MGNPFMRSLFKPILNTASRSAYKMRNSANELSKASRKASEQVYNSPYYKAYMEAATGKAGPTTVGPFTAGKRIKQVTALGTPIYAYNKLSDLGGLPFRTTDPEKEEVEDQKDIKVEEKPKPVLKQESPSEPPPEPKEPTPKKAPKKKAPNKKKQKTPQRASPLPQQSVYRINFRRGGSLFD